MSTTTTRARTRRTLAATLLTGLAAIAAVTAGGVPSYGVDGPAEAAPATTVSPTKPLLGSTIKVRATLPTKVSRPTRLQRKTGGGWNTLDRVRSATSGKVTYEVFHTVGTTYRILAPAVTIKGTHYGAVTSKARTVGSTARAELVSHRPDGKPASARSLDSAVSGDGRYVVFSSAGADVVPGLTLQVGKDQVYLWDRTTDEMTLVSHKVAQPTFGSNGYAFEPDLSTDGRYVVYSSTAADLVAGDSGTKGDIFRWDRLTDTTVKVSKDWQGQEGNEASQHADVSDDGSVVVFESFASDLLGPGGDQNNNSDAFVWTAAGDDIAVLNDNGSGKTTQYGADEPHVSGDGSRVCFTGADGTLPGDDNLAQDVFLRKLDVSKTVLVSLGDKEQEGNSYSYDCSLSRTGRYVAFASPSSTFDPKHSTEQKTNVFVRDTASGTTTTISRSRKDGSANGTSQYTAISADGSTVVFTSAGSNLVAGDTNGVVDVFIWRRATGSVELLVHDKAWGPANAEVTTPVLSADGRYVAVQTKASDLVGVDKNELEDSYLWRIR